MKSCIKSLEEAMKNELYKFANRENWDLTEVQVDGCWRSGGLLNIYATFEMLELYIKNRDGKYEQLKDYITRDEVKIFFIVSLLESLQKISSITKTGSRAAVKDFFNTYVSDERKRKVEASFSIRKSNESTSRQITFSEWVDVIYGIRSAFAHEVQYICQVFTTRRSNPYHYRNCASIKDVEGHAWLIELIARDFTFEDFRQLVSMSIREWLVQPNSDSMQLSN